MKRLYVFLMTLMLIFGLTVSAHATLMDRGGGMIYDTDLNITWLADANYAKTSGYDADGWMYWFAAMAWADTLVYGGFNDWRLPTTLQPDTNCTDTLSVGQNYGSNCTGSEMGHLFYGELGGTAGLSILSSGDPDLVFFTNIMQINPVTNENSYYWSGTVYAPDPTNAAWVFSFRDGYQWAVTMEAYNWAGYIWAVRDGDVRASVPEPSILLLLGSGLAGIALWRKRLVRKEG